VPVNTEHTPTARPYSVWGPVLVALGAGLWGTETLWRVRLNTVMPPDVMVFWEHVLLVALSLPFLLAHRHQLKPIPLSIWGALLASGVLGSALGALFFTMALGQMNASVANALLHLQPLISVFAAWALLKEVPSPRLWPWAGVAITAGVLIAFNQLSDWQHVWPNQWHWQSLSLLSGALTPAVGLILLTALCWGLSTVAGRAINTRLSIWVASPLRLIIGLLAMTVVVLCKGHSFTPTSFTPTSFAMARTWWDLAQLTVIAGFIPLFVYFKGLSITPAGVAAFWESAQVVAALGISWGVLGQALMPHQLLATLLLVVAVVQIDRLQAGHIQIGK
jgi:drug/metabolite transporter, DME family